MPIPASKRGLAITNAAFEKAWETYIHRYGFKGLNISNAIDSLNPDDLSRMTNVTHRGDGSVTSRPGETTLSTGGTKHHSMRRLNDPANNDWTRFHGVDTLLKEGQSGVLTTRDSGYSGDPLTMLPHRVPFNGQPWMFIADRSKMRKVAVDGTVKIIGLPAPTNAATAGGVDPLTQKTVVCSFETAGGDGDPSNASEWTLDGKNATGVATDIGGGTDAVSFEFHHALLHPYSGVGFAAINRSVDMSVITTGSGTVPASDNDIIRLYLGLYHPESIEEIKVFLVCAAGFDQTTANADGSYTGDAFVYTITQPANVFPLIIDDNTKAIRYGDPGYPLTRGDFVRQGVDATRGWDTITGLIFEVKFQPFFEGKQTESEAHLIGSELYMVGGGGPDTTDPATMPYDYRYTNYDITTGAEGNPSPVMSGDGLYNQRTTVTVSVDTYGDADIRQNIYRRGGTLTDNWYFVGTNSADGATFEDTLGDLEIAEAGTLETDNFQPVPTVDTNGNTVLNQPVPALWGPLEDFLFACGDPYRPGFVYFCKRGQPDSWPDTNVTEVCSSSEELMMGGIFGGQSFVFSKERMFLLYPNLSGEDASVTSAPTQCKKGMVNRWGVCVGAGQIWFINRDGIYRTSGGPEEWVSKNIDPLFRGQSANGYAPIDFSQDTFLRLEMHENVLWFQYMDTNGDIQFMCFDTTFNYWKNYEFGRESAAVYSDEGNDTSTLLIGGKATGKTYTHTGTSDDGLAIAAFTRTGAVTFSAPRDEKILGDQIVDLNSNGRDVTLTNYVNDESVTNGAVTVNHAAGRQRAIFDDFGTVPQRVRNLSTQIEWSTAASSPILYQLGTSYIVEPEVIINRMTQWDDLSHADESYVMGLTLDIDTGGGDADFVAEADFGGSIVTLDTFTINTAGRRKVKRSWTAGQANKVRLRPTNDCVTLVIYKMDWIAQPEPPRISKWDVHFENKWDAYYTGLDIFCDTGGATKTVVVTVDGVSLGTFNVVANGRKVVHLSFTPGRGHVFRFYATDSNDGLLYDYRWHLDEEPSEQTNWNQNFTIAGTEADKWLKGVVLQCDTFGQNKTVTIEVDGTTVQTLTVNTNGRKVVEESFSQVLGRVFRLLPTDSNPGRLYSMQWIFDQEPFKLTRWETQETTHTLAAWHYPIYGHITLKSTASVNLAVTAYNQSGTATTKNYTIASTSGAKVKVYVPFEATKGILYKYVLTSSAAFWLYREETSVMVREWGTEKTLEYRPFGNDDQDPTRMMTRADLAAGKSGGGTG